MKEKSQIWTIGHSNHSIATFLELLKEQEIQVLVDVRRFPTSRFEHFKKEQIQKWLVKNGIEYVWLGKELEAIVKADTNGICEPKFSEVA